MTTPDNSIAGLAKRIKAYARRPADATDGDFPSLAEAFLASPAAASPETAATPVAEIALAASRLARSVKDSAVLCACLRIMLGAGRFGRILAARFAQSLSVPLRELTALIATLPAGDRLALVHEMLISRTAARDRNMVAWLEQSTSPLAAADPRELAPFIASLGRRGETLAFPVRQILDNGLFGKWLNSRVKSAAGNENVDLLCHVLRALDDPERTRRLALSMTRGLIFPTPTALDTVARVAEAGDRDCLALFLKVLAAAKPELAGRALDGVIAQRTPKAGRLLAAVRRRKSGLARAAAARVPLLGDEAYRDYLDALPHGERDDARTEAFAALLGLAPDFVETLTREGSAPPTPEPDDAAHADASAPCPKPGMLARLFGRRHATLEKLLPKFRTVRDMDLSCSRVAGATLTDNELSSLNLSGSTFREVEILRCRADGCRFQGAAFAQATLTGGAFAGCDFSGADFADARFANCSFDDCAFTGAAFTRCELTDCRFRDCAMGGAAFFGAELRRDGFTASAMSATRFQETTAESCRFEDTDFTAAAFVGGRFRGMEFVDCGFEAAVLRDVRFQALEMPGCTMADCRIQNADLPHALFLNARLDQLTRLAGDLERAPLPDPSAIAPEVAEKVLSAWSREVTFQRREARMLGANRRRLIRALDDFEPAKRAFLRLLPHLLDTDLFEQRAGLTGIPACEVWGFVPGLTTLELARQFFPENTPSGCRPTIRILALYAMGSLGSVAQTDRSDLDCWVCCDGDADRDAEAGLKRKLDALSVWAAEEFGVEAHFFPMRMDDVRENRFASGDDEESSGTAQALLLKEEFYRTALRLAGKHIVWWVSPIGADAEGYATCVQAARRYPVAGQPRLEDFGHLAPVPPDEYFGGALWQMVKAVHAPFKSVLKLGLLETYAEGGPALPPLCDRIKRNVLLNRRDVRRVDPYGALFSVLHAHHARRGDREAARLLTDAFLSKADPGRIPFFMNLPARREDADLIRLLFGDEYVEPERIGHSRPAPSFERSLAMGDRVRRYMVDTYQHIRAGVRESGRTKSAIDAEDLTRMGRRIGANFSYKPHKVMRVPFMDLRGEGFALLHFGAEKHPGRKTVWEVRGGSRTQAGRPIRSLERLRRDADPVRLLAWLFANRLHRPESLLQADRTIAPVSLADLQRLLPTLGAFFPFDETFERNINDGLRPERVLRALIVCNLTVAPDIRRVEQASVVYTTNWGEMFCRTFERPGPEFEKTPSRFLARNLEQAADEPPLLRLFIPKGSQCKRINLV